MIFSVKMQDYKGFASLTLYLNLFSLVLKIFVLNNTNKIIYLIYPTNTYCNLSLVASAVFINTMFMFLLD